MKARIWKDRGTGRWCYDVRGPGLRATGYRASWGAALAAAWDELNWIGERRHAWPESLLPPGWR